MKKKNRKRKMKIKKPKQKQIQNNAATTITTKQNKRYCFPKAQFSSQY